MTMNKLIASFLCAGVLSAASALADDAVVPQGGANATPAVQEQVKQDKAVVKADRKQLHKDRSKLKKDRSKAGMKPHQHKKQDQQPAQAAPVQPQTN